METSPSSTATAREGHDAAARDPLADGLRAVGGALLGLPRWAGALLALAWMGFIFRLSSLSTPVPIGPRVPKFFNDLAHAPLFGLIAFLALIALPRRSEPFAWPRLDRAAWLTVLVLVGVYGAFDELHQSTTPGRHASVGDVLTDVAGATAVLWVATGLGAPRGSVGPIWRRLLAGLALCCLAAANASYVFGGD